MLILLKKIAPQRAVLLHAGQGARTQDLGFILPLQWEVTPLTVKESEGSQISVLAVVFWGRTVRVQAMEAGLGFENPNALRMLIFHGEFD